MNNQVCIPSFYFTLLMIVFIIACIWGVYNLIQFMQNKSDWANINSSPTSNLSQPIAIAPTPISPDVVDDLAFGEQPAKRRDYRRIYDPLKEPSRRYVTYPGGYVPGGNINIPTQGYLPSYQLMGYLSSDQEGPGKMLKLFGRRLDTYKYEYYTTNHKDTTLKIPLEIKGDKELMDGDTVHVPGYQTDYKVTLYELEAPKYIPYI